MCQRDPWSGASSRILAADGRSRCCIAVYGTGGMVLGGSSLATSAPPAWQIPRFGTFHGHFLRVLLTMHVPKWPHLVAALPSNHDIPASHQKHSTSTSRTPGLFHSNPRFSRLESRFSCCPRPLLRSRIACGMAPRFGTRRRKMSPRTFRGIQKWMRSYKGEGRLVVWTARVVARRARNVCLPGYYDILLARALRGKKADRCRWKILPLRREIKVSPLSKRSRVSRRALARQACGARGLAMTRPASTRRSALWEGDEKRAPAPTPSGQMQRCQRTLGSARRQLHAILPSSSERSRPCRFGNGSCSPRVSTG